MEHVQEDLSLLIRGTPSHYFKLGSGVEIIREADLESCTVKSVIADLERRLGHSIDTELAQVTSVIDKVLEEKLIEVEDEQIARQLQEEETRSAVSDRISRASRKRRKQEPKATKGKRTAPANGFNRPLWLSEALSAVVGGARQVMSSIYLLAACKIIQHHFRCRGRQLSRKFGNMYACILCKILPTKDISFATINCRQFLKKSESSALE